MWLAGYDYEDALQGGHVMPAFGLTQRLYARDLNVTTAVYGYKVESRMAETVMPALDLRVHDKQVCMPITAICKPLHTPPSRLQYLTSSTHHGATSAERQ